LILDICIKMYLWCLKTRTMQYIGEHLLPGQIGLLMTWFGFGFSLLAFTVYSLLHFKIPGSENKWFLAARASYWLHVLSLTAVSVALYYIILNHYFEYSYVWQYSSRDLDMKYIISCFWAGQEGSFLFWALVQALVGLLLVGRNREWEAPVMAVFSLSQVFVTSMLLGVEFWGIKIGQSPFTLLRETVDSVQGTIFQEQNYLTMLLDGNGLNPLLENIWMTIHPPVLFIGYALALVPFSYAIASLLRKDYHAWIRKAIPWTLAALTVLGAGILLGGAWAYVSLTFGGFWAWDPVENSSLVPWMTLAAGLHFMIIARKQNQALMFSYLFIALSYVLVLYASYLTRSGVLADTSAHSFGENGMTSQLLIFLLAFLALTALLVLIRYRGYTEKLQDNYRSREFWMYLGSLVIVLAAFQIMFTTSIPVINALFGSDFAPPAEPVAFYNRWQSIFSIFIVALIALSQVLNYSYNSGREVVRKIAIPLAAAIAGTLIFSLNGTVREPVLIVFLFSLLLALFATIVNFLFKTSRPGNTGGFISHLGIIIFLLGVLLTFSNSRIISANTSSYDLGDSRANSENLLLMRHDTLYMGGYYVVYTDAVKRQNTTTYKVDFLKYKEGRFYHRFSLFPSVNVHPRMGAVYNPATRRFLMRDIYTYIAVANQEPDYIVIKAIMNPYINILWFGSLLMTAGLAYSMFRRMRKR